MRSDIDSELGKNGRKERWERWRERWIERWIKMERESHREWWRKDGYGDADRWKEREIESDGYELMSHSRVGWGRLRLGRGLRCRIAISAVPHCKKVSRVGMHTFVHAVLTSYRFLDHMLCPFLSDELSCHGTSKTGPDRLSSEAKAPSARLWIWPSWTRRKPKVLVSMNVMTRNTLWTRIRCRSSLQCMQWHCNRHLCVAWQLSHWSASDVHSRCVLVLP